MTQTANFVLSSWKVFVDGVEIPHQGVSISYEVDAPTSAQVFLEPGKELQQFRPDSLIHVFSRDPFPADTEADDQDLYRLVWEGVSTGLQFQKTPSSRFVTLSAVGLTGYLARAKAFMIGVGLLPFTTILTGSTQINIETGGGSTLYGDILDFSLLTNQITDPDMEGEDVPLQDQATPKFSARITRTIHEVCSFNAFLRQQVARSRMLDKIAGVPDSMLDGVLSLSVIRRLMGHAANTVREDDSALDIVRHLMSYGFHHLTDFPFPHRPSAQPETGELHPRLTVDAPRIPKQARRNDTAILPETYYTLPPPCNIILPDFVMDLSIQRDFGSEATRHIILDPFIGVAAAAPRRVQASYTDPKQFYGMRSAEDPAESAYGDETANLLAAFSDRELEKGVTATVSNSDFESFAASSFQQVDLSKSGNTADKDQKKNAALASGQNLNMTETMTSMANYQLTLKKYQRVGGCTLVGHHYIAPGFPAVICDKDMSFLGNVQGLTLAVTPEGQETTSVRMSKVRPVPPIEDEVAQELLTSVIDKARESVSAMEEDVAQDSADEYVPPFIATRDEAFAKATEALDALYEASVMWQHHLIRDTTDFSMGDLEQQWAKVHVKYVSGIPVVDWWTRIQSAGYQFPSSLETTISWYKLAGTPKVRTDMATQLADAGKALVAAQQATLSVLSEIVQHTGVQSAAVQEELVKAQTTLTILVDSDGDAPSDIRTKITGFILDGLPESVANTYSLNKIVEDLKTAVNITYDNSNFVGKDVNTIAPGSAGGLALTMIHAGRAANQLTLTLQGLESLFDQMEFPIADLDKLQAVQANTIAQHEDGIFQAFQELEDTLDLPSPPPFFSEDLTNLAKLDTLYADLLGCPKFYTEGDYKVTASAASAEVVDQLSTLTSTKSQQVNLRAEQLQKQVEFYYQYVQGLRSISQIYPITGLTSEEEAAGASWESKVHASGLQSSMRWAYNTLYRREGISLRVFAEDNALRLTTETSTSPEPHAFWKLSPSLTYELTHDDGSVRVWDDSIFSKIVDENQFKDLDLTEEINENFEELQEAQPFFPGAVLTGIASRVSDATEAITTAITDSRDPVIEAARKQTTDEFLTTGPRQALMLQYSRAHFGSRGQDGT